MKKSTLIAFYIVMLALAFTWQSAEADVPSEYYSSLNGKSGQALKNAVHDLAIKHTVHSYSSLWGYFRDTDHMPSDASRVWDMYSDKTYYFTSNGYGSTSGMNREHSLPKSWWGGLTNVAAYTDLNHLYPSDADANTAKLNWPLGEVSTVSFNNGVSRVGTPKAGQGGGASTVFEPDDRYKGDFARTYFYMAACYQDLVWKYTFMLSNSTWLTLNQWSIDLLLRWARQDPVSDKEKARNDAVYRCQNNRNPFIDNPELMEYIWGDRAGDVFNVGAGQETYQGDPELIVPTQGTQLDFGQIGLGKSVSLKLYVKGLGLTHNLSITIYRDDAEMFTSSVSQVDRAIANSDDGYPVIVTYTPTAVGTHRSRLVVSDGGLVGSVGVELKGTCLPAPNLATVKALPALEVTDTTYLATWQPLSQEVDYYVVNRTIYDENNNKISTETFTTDDGTENIILLDRNSTQAQTYTVQAYRLGYMSAESNTITVDASGITGVMAELPMALLSAPGGVVVKCGTSLTDVSIYTMTGQLMSHLPRVDNDMFIALPPGVYVLTSRSAHRATKLIVW